jgi:hypothetical protein
MEPLLVSHKLAKDLKRLVRKSHLDESRRNEQFHISLKYEQLRSRNPSRDEVSSKCWTSHLRVTRPLIANRPERKGAAKNFFVAGLGIRSVAGGHPRTGT